MKVSLFTFTPLSKREKIRQTKRRLRSSQIYFISFPLRQITIFASFYPRGRKKPMEVSILLHIVTLVFLRAAIIAIDAEEKLLNVSRLKMFVDELQDMPRIEGFDLVNGVYTPKSLKIGMYMKKWKFHRDLSSTPVFAFGTSRRVATIPGPTIEAHVGTHTNVTWKNHLPSKHILPWDPSIPTAIPPLKKGVPTVVHLHGGIHEPESDGNSKSWFTAGFKEKGSTWTKEEYHYPNFQQPGSLWYHDHAMGLTRVNLLAGLFGAYIMRDPRIEVPLNLPHGKEFDRPLIIFDRSFNKYGSIYMNHTGNNPTIHPQWQPEYFGSVIIVNGKAWPYMRVRRRRYRFRIINASNARFFNLFFINGLDFIVVGSDSTYLEKPVMVKEVLLAPSEIADVVVDFSKSKSRFAILANNAAYPYPSGDPVNESNDKVMKFIVKSKRDIDTSSIPRILFKYPSLDHLLSTASATRYIAMFEYASSAEEPTRLLLNGKPYDYPVTETPKVGTIEIWNVINLTEDNHPFHVHLGLLAALDQKELVRVEELKSCMMKRNDALGCRIRQHASGREVGVLENERGWKNVYKMRPGAVTRLLVKFGFAHSNDSYPFDASGEPGYVYHCHILDHEDNEMMRPFKLIK